MSSGILHKSLTATWPTEISFAGVYSCDRVRFPSVLLGSTGRALGRTYVELLFCLMA